MYTLIHALQDIHALPFWFIYESKSNYEKYYMQQNKISSEETSVTKEFAF